MAVLGYWLLLPTGLGRKALWSIIIQNGSAFFLPAASFLDHDATFWMSNRSKARQYKVKNDALLQIKMQIIHFEMCINKK